MDYRIRVDRSLSADPSPGLPWNSDRPGSTANASAPPEAPQTHATPAAGDRRLDGNAAAGPLRDLIAVDLTSANSTCAHCGNMTQRDLSADAPALVVRCPSCTGIVLRYAAIGNQVRIPGTHRLCGHLGRRTEERIVVTEFAFQARSHNCVASSGRWTPRTRSRRSCRGSAPASDPVRFPTRGRIPTPPTAETFVGESSRSRWAPSLPFRR